MVAFVFIFITVLTLVSPEGLCAGERLLQGRVFQNDNETPAKGAAISIVIVGNIYTTGDDGGYQLFLPDFIRVGQTIEVYVKKRGLAIHYPKGGKITLPEDLTAHILLLPKNSDEFLSADHIDRLLESLLGKTRTQVKTDGTSDEIDLTQPLREYASEHDLTYEKVRAKVEESVAYYEEQRDLHLRCLAAVYRNDRDNAAGLCKDKGRAKAPDVGKKRQEIERLSKTRLRGQSDHGMYADVITGRKVFASLGQVEDHPNRASLLGSSDTKIGPGLYAVTSRPHIVQVLAELTQAESK